MNSLRRDFLFLWVLGMGCVILLWHSLGLPYNYYEHELHISHYNICKYIRQNIRISGRKILFAIFAEKITIVGDVSIFVRLSYCLDFDILFIHCSRIIEIQVHFNHGSRFSFYLAYSAHQNIEPSTNGNFVDHDPPAYDTIAYNNSVESAHNGREYRRETNSNRSDVGSALGHERVETNPYHAGYDQTGRDDAPPKYTELPASVTYPHSPERRIITSQVYNSSTST